MNAAEAARNDGVAAFQGNRNPFIDHPEWVAAAFIPHVALARAGTNVTLCWTNDYVPRLVSEQSTNLSSGWLPTTTSRDLTSTNTWAITLPVGPGARFYRVPRVNAAHRLRVLHRDPGQTSLPLENSAFAAAWVSGVFCDFLSLGSCYNHP